jgi:hypothetical protein
MAEKENVDTTKNHDHICDRLQRENKPAEDDAANTLLHDHFNVYNH